MNLGRTILASIQTKFCADFGLNLQPRIWPENDPNDSGHILSANIRPDFGGKHSARNWAKCSARRSARIPAERFCPNHTGHLWAELWAEHGPKNSARIFLYQGSHSVNVHTCLYLLTSLLIFHCPWSKGSGCIKRPEIDYSLATGSLTLSLLLLTCSFAAVGVTSIHTYLLCN